MKRFLLFVFAIVAFAACEQAPIEEQSAIRYEAPDTITVGFEGDDTRIQLNEAQKTVWNSGDEVSVFYKSDGNDCYKFTGETGERNGTLKRASVGEYSRRGDYVIVAYPYNPDYLISLTSNTIEATLPAVQEYATDSYGVGSSPMIAMGDYKQFALKNTCGWLKLQLTGDGEVVKSITFKGNDGEQVAGDILIVAEDASVVLADASIDIKDDEVGGALLGDDDIITVVTLDCGEGVALGKEATAFYIALPPQTFDDGFTVEVACVDGSKMIKSSNKALSIERNHIQPMAAMEFTPSVPNNQIWYTSSDGDVVKPNKTKVFGANIISNTYNNGKGIITFDGDVTTIGEDAFDSCTSLTSVTIPDSVTTIGDAAFWDCDSLTSVTIGDSVTTIGIVAFAQCYCLTSVAIPDSVTTIGYAAFRSCYSLTEFKGKFASENGRCLIINGILNSFAIGCGVTEYTIPDSVTTIGEYAFFGCDSLTSVTIPDSVTTIGYTAFAGCDSLTSVTIPDSVTTIGEGAFISCDSLTSVTIPDSVTTIGNDAFYLCTSLPSVTIGDSVKSIGVGAFAYCDSLTSVYCKTTTPPAMGYTDVFHSNGSGRKIYVPAGSVNAYKSTGYWSWYAYSIVGYDFENGVVVE